MRLIYVADPMCSWCYGFGATIERLLAEPQDAAPLELALVMGGLRPGTTAPLTTQRADEIVAHWRRVAEASGRRFAGTPHGALHAPGFVYDTEPASRAVVTLRSRWPRVVWRYFDAVQRAFFADARDVTRPEVLADIAEPLGVPRADFAEAFASGAMRAATSRDFAQAASWGIRGFPAVIVERGDALHLVAQGYLPIDALRERLRLPAHPAAP